MWTFSGNCCFKARFCFDINSFKLKWTISKKGKRQKRRLLVVEEKKSADLIPGTRNVISAFRGLCPLNTLQLLKRGCLDLLKRLHVNAFIHMFNEPQRHHTWMRNTAVKTEPWKNEYYLFFFILTLFTVHELPAMYLILRIKKIKT